jgi:putative endonuclease
VTSNLPQRAFQHRNGLIDGYTKKNACHTLVLFERFDDLQEARACEFRMKKWHRAWKLKAIEERNPDWRDLFDDLLH